MGIVQTRTSCIIKPDIKRSDSIMTMEHRSGVKVELICQGCGNKFLRPRYTIRPDQKSIFCSRECLKKTPEERLETKRRCRKIWNDNNREHVRARSKKWRQENPEKNRISKKKEYEAHKDKYDIRRKEYYEKNKEDILQWRKEHYATNKDEIKKRVKEYYKANTEKRLVYAQKHWRDNRPSSMWSRSKRSAINKGLKFDLTKDWIRERLNKGMCEMSGLPFDMIGKRTSNSPSVDRIKPDGDYTQDNCRIVLWSINRALSNYGEDYILSTFSKILEKRQ